VNRLVTIILFFLILVEGFGQLRPLTDQYVLNGLGINPAYAGSSEVLSISMFYRNQWVGFDGAPTTTTLSLHSPLRNEKVAIGVLVMSDRIGVSKETGLLANYAYRLEAGRGKLSFGLAAGLSMQNEAWAELTSLDDGDDLIFDGAGSYLLPDFSFGSYYYTERYFAGISMPFFLTHEFNQITGKYKILQKFSNINYMITGGYLFNISDDIKLLPSVLVKVNPGTAAQADINASMIYKQKFWIGASLRSSGGMVWLLQYQVNNQFRIAYSYGAEFSKLATYQNGSHEIMLKYDFGYTIEVISPRYF
jgi:type IX secretion system PorP/SprF family membrane protein